jgi:8-oxo-dGTP diphosphatase
MTFTYEYPHPAVTTDIVIFTVTDGALKVLLIKRGTEPFKGKWALPGGFMKMEESIEQCAQRELAEETGLTDIYLEQLATFGAVDRDPRERVISVSYYALIPSDNITLKAGTDAAEAKWFSVDELPELSFDHSDILSQAQKRLAAKMDYSTVGFKLMPREFTLSHLQDVYEKATGKSRDKRNFRKWVFSLNVIEATGKKFAKGPHRPAMLYQVIDPNKVENIR